MHSAGGTSAGRKRNIKSCLGQLTISSKQAIKLKLRKGTRLSPQIEKCCLLLVSNESFVSAEKDIQILTGIKVPHTTQHRLINNYHLSEPKITKRAKSLSVDGGTVRLRTPLGQQSEWKNFKAVKVHGRMGMAFFQDNQSLLSWINQQPLSKTVDCLGDGHDGVWNIVEQIGTKDQRREILDWYHLMENLHKVGGSNQRLRQARKYLWYGLVEDAISLFEELNKKQAKNFQNYLRKHRTRIPDYQLYQQLDICIGSGSVESWIKQIGSRIKIIGAQWEAKNVSQMLKLRCAYLNGDIALDISA